MGRREGGGDTADGGVHGEEGREGIQLMVECSAWGGGKGEGIQLMVECMGRREGEGIRLMVECSAWGGGKGGDTADGGVQCMGRREGRGYS